VCQSVSVREGSLSFIDHSGLAEPGRSGTPLRNGVRGGGAAAPQGALADGTNPL
jgi:hypothetical protein